MMFVKKWPLEYQKVFKTYISTYLWDSSVSSDSCDNCGSSDSSDSTDSSDRSDQKNLFFTQKNLTSIVKLKNSNCD